MFAGGQAQTRECGMPNSECGMGDQELPISAYESTWFGHGIATRGCLSLMDTRRSTLRIGG
jgi:hypothetical protein